ncbi:MAG: ABC transporter substrate-binding protein, partial [Chloroflexi bacterium]|nr:ABC transporter substrate-binding protein [Chloroflexota bacterium]
NYWDIAARPIVDSVSVFNILEGATMIAALKSRQLDFIESYPVAFYADLSGTSGITISDTPDIGFQAIFFNRRSSEDRASKGIRSALPTDDVRIRRAIGNALDRQGVIDRAFQGRAIPAYSPIPPAQTLYFDTTLKDTSLQRYNPEEARRLLAEVAAEPGAAALGIAPDGDFTLTLSLAVQGSTPAQAIKAAIEQELGITIELELMENAVFQPRYQTMEMESGLTGSGGDPDPDDAVDDWFADGSKFNGFGYNNPRVNELNFLQKTSTDVEQRRQYITEIQEILSNDMPAAFTYHFLTSVAFRDYVKGYVHVPALADLDTVWLDR